jgi:hypothetical protein
VNIKVLFGSIHYKRKCKLKKWTKTRWISYKAEMYSKPFESHELLTCPWDGWELHSSENKLNHTMRQRWNIQVTLWNKGQSQGLVHVAAFNWSSLSTLSNLSCLWVGWGNNLHTMLNLINLGVVEAIIPRGGWIHPFIQNAHKVHKTLQIWTILRSIRWCISSVYSQQLQFDLNNFAKFRCSRSSWFSLGEKDI